LSKDGVVFLNDIYRALGFKIVQEGQYLGWALKGKGDGIIHFNIKRLQEPGDPIKPFCKALHVEFNIDPEPVIQYM
jgi:hypothetical protein